MAAGALDDCQRVTRRNTPALRASKTQMSTTEGGRNEQWRNSRSQSNWEHEKGGNGQFRVDLCERNHCVKMEDTGPRTA